METLRFKSVIEIIGVNPYVLVTAGQANKLQPNWKKPMPVLVQVNERPAKPWAINMMPVGDGNFYLYLHGDVRKASNTRVGDLVSVNLCFDDQYQRDYPVPSWFLLALDQIPEAKNNWERLTTSRKKEISRYLASLKSPQARERNLKRALEVLSGKSGRFMARDWKNGV